MAVTVGQVVSADFSGSSSHTLTTDATPQVGDLLVAIHGNDFYTASVLETPADGNGGTWTLQATADGGSRREHVKAWTAPVTVAGAQSVTFSETESDEEKMCALYVLSGAEFDAADGSSGSGTTAVAPSVAGTADGLVLCHWQAGQNSVPTVTPPAGMTQQYSVTDGSFTRGVGATQALTATGATGTFTAAVTDTLWAAVTVTFKPSGGSTPPAFSGTGSAAVALTASASGTKATVGTGIGVLGLTPAATGSKATSGSASDALALTATASGSKAAIGSSIAAVALTATATGSKHASGTGVVALALTASGTGTKHGAGAGSAALALTAAGSSPGIGHSGTGHAQLALTATATGIAHRAGGGHAALALTAGGGASVPSRDIDLIVGPILSGWEMATAATSGWDSGPISDNEWTAEPSTSGWDASPATT